MADEHEPMREIFLNALEIKSPDERSAYLDQACGARRTVRSRIDALILAHERPESLLDRAALDANGRLGETELMPNVRRRSGDRIGPYELVEEIGEGGFGIVYLARQQHPVRRQVALKIIKPGMDTRETVTRFEAERQALALMDHPGIAHVLDAGATDSGHPYFVMELVRGVPVTEYCDQCNLTTSERLRLFMGICQAVQHAHQKGIIHRDLKPTNVLVTMQDGKPAVKVIDFGVAKAVNQRLTERTLMTGMLQLVGTPLYMSPEQVEMGPLDIDTRSDIYSLGVLLYELLTGTTPIERARFSEANYDELRRIIREEDPPTPSARLSTLEPGAITTVAEQRRTDSRRLQHVVRGELDWIVMRALDKDRRRRYETANDLARDIERLLSHEPVEACPPSAAYRFRKFARRNRTRLIAATLALLLVIVGWGAATVLIAHERNTARLAAVEAEKERKRAEENLLKAKQAVDTWFTKVAGDLNGQPHMTNVQRALLEQALEFYKEFMRQKADDPAIRREAALAYGRVAFIYGLLGRDEESADTAQQAVTILTGLSREKPGDADLSDALADSYRQLGIHSFFAGETENACDAYRTAIDTWKKLVEQHPTVPNYQRRVATTHVDLANALARLPGKLPEAESNCRESLARWKRFREQFPDLPMQTFEEAHSHHWLASVLTKARHFDEVELHLRKTVELRARLATENPQHGDIDALLAHAKIYLANELLRQEKFAEAERELLSAADILGGLVDDHPEVVEYRRHLIMCYSSLCACRFAQGRFEEAEQALREKGALNPPESAATLDDLCNISWTEYDLGILAYHRGAIQDAADLFRKASERFERVLLEAPEVSNARRRALNALAWVLGTCPLTQFQDAQRSLAFAKQLAQRDPLNGGHWADIGIAYYRLGKWDQAIEACKKANRLGDNENKFASYVLAMAYWRRGEQGEARAWYERATDSQGRQGPEQLLFRDAAKQLLGIDDAKQGTDNGTGESMP